MRPAVPLVIDASDSGWYDDGGDHFSTIENYQAGMRGTEYCDFFVFDLTPALGVTIDSAELRIELYGDGFESPDPFETYALFDVGPTSMATLTLGGPGGPIGQAVFADLGTGTSYGGVPISTSDNGTIVHIPLNAAALAALSSVTGSFAFGGAITTHQGDPLIREFAFGSSDENLIRQLVINPDPVPEPGTAGLLSLGLALFAVRLRRS